MFDQLRKKIGLVYARFHFREPDKVLTFTDAVKRAKSALVIMPLEQTPSEMSRPLLQFIQNRFSGGNLTVVVPEEAGLAVKQLPRCEVINIRREDIGSFLLPKKGIIDRIRLNQYDLVLDLNMDFCLPAAYMCKASRSRLRVGFATEYADTFFNFQIKRGAAPNVKSTYERFAACLRMF